MADEVGLGKTICLFSNTHFVTLDVTPEPTEEEAKNVELLRAHLPQLVLQPLGPTTETKLGTSFLGLGSMVYCVGCPELPVHANNQIKLFNPFAREFNFDTSFPKMNERRCCPALAAIGEVIYVFGGVPYDKLKKGCIWAECLDTSQPKDKQACVALAEPPFYIPVESWLTSLPLGDEEILIMGENINQNALLYNVKKGSWTEYKFGDEDFSAISMLKPVFVEGDETMYWLSGHTLWAFNMAKKIFYSGKVYNSVLYDFGDCFHETTVMGPVLMHVKDNIFCFFTLYNEGYSGTGREILECTKIQVAKLDLPLYGDGILRIDVIGYQSYKCDGMWRLYGGVDVDIMAHDATGTGKNTTINRRLGG